MKKRCETRACSTYVCWCRILRTMQKTYPNFYSCTTVGNVSDGTENRSEGASRLEARCGKDIGWDEVFFPEEQRTHKKQQETRSSWSFPWHGKGNEARIRQHAPTSRSIHIHRAMVGVWNGTMPTEFSQAARENNLVERGLVRHSKPSTADSCSHDSAPLKPHTAKCARAGLRCDAHFAALAKARVSVEHIAFPNTRRFSFKRIVAALEKKLLAGKWRIPIQIQRRFHRPSDWTRWEAAYTTSSIQGQRMSS